MNCHLCPNKIVIETDPENRDYKMISGAKKKIETWSPSSNETIEFLSDDQKIKLVEDPFYKLEHESKDKQKAKNNEPILQQLIDLSNQNSYDDFSASQMLRKRLRTEKKNDKELTEKLQQKGINFKLLPEKKEDVLLSKSIQFQSSNKVNNLSTERKKSIAKSIFKNSSLAKPKSQLLGALRNSQKADSIFSSKINFGESNVRSVKRKQI